MAEGKKTGGRQAGTPNKATREAREAMALFVEGNAHRLTEWLDRVSDGVKEQAKDEAGNLLVDKNLNPVMHYTVQPNPAKAFELFQSVVEYHIPKLARTEHVGNDDKPLVIEHNVNVFGELLKAVKMQRQAGE